MTFSLLTPGAFAAETEKWNGTVLGFEKPQKGLLGEMAGIRPILEDNGFNYNLGYLNEMGYNAGGGYNRIDLNSDPSARLRTDDQGPRVRRDYHDR